MPNNPVRTRAVAVRYGTTQNQLVRTVSANDIIMASQTPAQKNGQSSTGGPVQRGALNPSPGGKGGGGFQPN
jgi:hypothetical protein